MVDTPSADREGQHDVAPLRILMVAPPWYEVPPRGYGGIEVMISNLVAGLIERGHEVVLAGVGADGTAARFVRTYADAQSDRLGETIPELVHAAEVTRWLATREAAVDVIHDHTIAGPLAAARRPVPTLATVHHPMDGELADYYRSVDDIAGLVAVSAAQRSQAPGIAWRGVVHNAIDVSAYPCRADKGDYVVSIGRISPDKGTHVAIDAARAAGRRIVVAGRMAEAGERDYYDAEIAPRLGRDVEFIGEVSVKEKYELMASAHCFVFPIQWDEPFGIVMAEALACGTPVVALDRGAVREVVVDGWHGRVCARPDDLPAAIDSAGRIDPAACRARVEAAFDTPVMARAYARAYHQLIHQRVD